MSRETKFKVRDVRRLVEAARAAELNPTAVEVDVKGCIRVITGKPEHAGNDLDKWIEEHP
jgi:hypothetical protein